MKHRLRILRHPIKHFVQNRRMHNLERNWHDSASAQDHLFVLRTLSRYQDHNIDITPPPLPQRAESAPIPPEAWEAFYKPRHHMNPEPLVDIVMQVTDSYDAVIHTLYRLLTAANETPMRVVLVLAEHPDNKLIAKLRRLQELDLFDLLQANNDESLVTLTNFALQRHDKRDIVLLSSNTELPDHWLDRLRKTALTPYGSIATASPWTTAGGITGYPDSTGSLATALGDTAMLDAICFSLFDDGLTHSIPAPSPNLTYIPRHTLGSVGPLPEQTKTMAESFALWSGNATEKGFDHLFTPHILVGAYTTPKTSKHTAAEESDLTPSRQLIDQTRLRAGAIHPTLIIDGLANHASYDTGTLHLTPDSEHSAHLRLGLPDARLFPHLSFALDDPAQNLITLCESLDITRIALRSLAGFPSRMLEYSILLADRLGASLHIELADDYLICPGLIGAKKTCAAVDLESGYLSFAATYPLDTDGMPLWLWRLRASQLFARAETIAYATPELQALYQRYYNIS